MPSNSESTTKKKLEELETLYSLNPRIRDIIVEGRDDAALIRWYLSEIGDSNAKVYAVDDRVNVPREVIAAVHDDINKRGMVVGLASLVDSWNLRRPSVTCIIDSDFDFLQEGVREYPHLLRTDLAAMEVYGLQERPLNKFLVTIAKSEQSARDVTALLKPVWATIYTVRFVLKYNCDGVGLVSDFASKCFSRTGDIIDAARELLRASDQSIRGAALDELLAHHSTYLAKIPGDDLNGIRGHDIAPVLAKFLNLKNDMARDENLERLLRACLDPSDLHEWELFKSIRNRVDLSPTG